MTLGGDRAARLVAGGAAARTLAACGLGAIIGGALGNALDRLAHGAVVDFLDLHAFGRHFFVFNLADAAINVGVALLVIDLVFGSRISRSGAGAPASPAGAAMSAALCRPRV